VVGLDLNPYPGHTLKVDGREYDTYQKIGVPVYVYLLPTFCRLVSTGAVISGSQETDVLKFTTNPSIFDAASTSFNKLAVLLGIVSCTAPVKPSDITLLDARSRGGGYDDAFEGMYDVGYFTDITYPERGFLIFDITQFWKDDEAIIREAIERNIPAGTVYKIRWTPDVDTTPQGLSASLTVNPVTVTVQNA
jgi:hypothetical protein